MTDSTAAKKKFTEEQKFAIRYYNEVDAHMGDEAYWTKRADGEGFDLAGSGWTGMARWEACEASHSDNSMDTLAENGLTVADTLPTY
jgi:hypothetical protein